MNIKRNILKKMGAWSRTGFLLTNYYDTISIITEDFKPFDVESCWPGKSDIFYLIIHFWEKILVPRASLSTLKSTKYILGGADKTLSLNMILDTQETCKKTLSLTKLYTTN